MGQGQINMAPAANIIANAPTFTAFKKRSRTPNWSKICHKDCFRVRIRGAQHLSKHWETSRQILPKLAKSLTILGPPDWLPKKHLLEVAPANQTKERSVHELFTGAFWNKSSMWIVLVFLRRNTRIHKIGRNSWTFRFGPFFGLVCWGDSWTCQDKISPTLGLGEILNVVRGRSVRKNIWHASPTAPLFCHKPILLGKRVPEPFHITNPAQLKPILSCFCPGLLLSPPFFSLEDKHV